jgi:transketolase
MATGLALENKIPIVYSITPFIIYRPFEFIRNYLNHEKIPVKIVGGGRDYDYGTEGFTHHAAEDLAILSNFKNIELMKPETFNKEIFKNFISTTNPVYLNLSR